jgi:23S rRNA-/tRNA-specific pseudouridylate synthase
VAWIRGTLPEPRVLEHFLLKDPKTNVVRVVKPGVQGAKEARLRLAPLSPPVRGVWFGTPVSLVEFVLDTGRSHQIRVQSAAEGFPILGDEKYGPTPKFESRFGRPALHSWRISFAHPKTGQTLKCEAPIPPDMEAVRTGAV